MSTRLIKALTEKGNHAVGNLNNLKIKTVNGGAIVIDADVDNFTLVELGFNSDGERTCKQLADKANKAYLIASPEFRPMGEELVDFYNAVGDRARIVVLEPNYTRFDTSAYSLNTGVTSISAGQVAHFDVTTKKFIVSAVGSEHTDYAGSSAQFVVVGNEDDLEYVAGKATIRLEVTKA
jgi:hypothetical protein